MKSIDLSGHRYGRLTVKEKTYSISLPSRQHTAWICRCDCGAEIVAKTNCLRTGNVRSCGCFKKDIQKNRAGPRIANMTEYQTWARMKGRCYNKNNTDYKDYGGRGITVCDRWKDSFENFLLDMGNRPSDIHSIDRIDNNKGYSPDNCRWATNNQQSRNKRNNINITFKGRTMILSDWALELGVNWVTLFEKLQKQPLEKAMQSKKENQNVFK